MSRRGEERRGEEAARWKRRKIVRGRDWEHLDVPHLGFASCPSGRTEHTVPVVFSAANPASSRDIPAAYRAEPEQRVGAMVMTPDTRASRRTRDPETDPRPFFESSSKRSGRDVPPRSRCPLLLLLLHRLLVLFYSSPPFSPLSPLLSPPWRSPRRSLPLRYLEASPRQSNFAQPCRDALLRSTESPCNTIHTEERARLEGRWSQLRPSWTYGVYGLWRSTRFGASC